MLFSCKKEEKELALSLNNVKISKTGVYSIAKSSSLTESRLNKLKGYFDNFYHAGLLFVDLSLDDKFYKTVKKYVKKDENKAVCEKLFISYSSYKRLRSKCNYDGFNFCPYTYSRYREIKNKVIRIIKSSIDSDLYAETKCNNYDY